MKKIKLFLSVAAVAGMTALMGVGSAMATSPYCKITEVDAAGSATGATYIYCTPNATTMPQATVYYCYTTGDKLVSLASAAAAGQTTVRLWEASTFPTTGTYRYGGVCNWIEMFPGY